MPLDIGIGLMLGALLHSLTTINYGICLSMGVAATLLPDLDFVWVFIRTKTMPHSSHRDGLHYPLLFTPLVGLAGALVSPLIGMIFGDYPLTSWNRSVTL